MAQLKARVKKLLAMITCFFINHRYEAVDLNTNIRCSRCGHVGTWTDNDRLGWR